MDDEEIYKRVQARKKGVDLTPTSYRKEAAKLLTMIDEILTDERTQYLDLRDGELELLGGIGTDMKNPGFEPTERQIFWLRDIKDRLVDNE